MFICRFFKLLDYPITSALMLAFLMGVAPIPVEAGSRSAASTSAPRVVGGEPLEDLGMLPFLVRVEAVNGNLCTGSLIAPYWVLTAAHCGEVLKVAATPGLPPSAFPQYIRATRTIMYPQYDPFTSLHDIALVELSESAELSPPLDPATGEPLYIPSAIGTPSAPPADTSAGVGKVYFAGFGLVSQEPDVLPEVANFAGPISTLPSNSPGCTAFNSTGPIDPDTQLCHDGKGPDTCNGDSGGAVFAIEEGEYVQYGIVSYGSLDCGTSTGVATYLPPYLPWVRDVISGNQMPNGIVANLEAPFLPSEGAASTASGISNVQGWAYTTSPGAEIDRHIEVFIDGTFAMLVPCCGDRRDVEAAGGTLLSGFSGVYNWGLLATGAHELEVRIKSTIGEELTIRRDLRTSRFGDYPFVQTLEPTDGDGNSYNGNTLSCQTVPEANASGSNEQTTIRCFNWKASARRGSTLCQGPNPKDAYTLVFEPSSQSFKLATAEESTCFR